MRGRSWETRFSKRRRPKKHATHLGQEIGFTLQAGGQRRRGHSTICTGQSGGRRYKAV